MQTSKIEWLRGPDGSQGYSWNPTSGCSLGCHYCYAAAMARRFKRSFAPTCHPERLDQPLKLKKPARIFVDSAGDLFDSAIPDEFIAEVFAVMAVATNIDHNHTMIVLTKQAARMQGLCSSPEFIAEVCDCAKAYTPYEVEWPLPNLHLGVTVTNQRDADERVPLLLQTPAAVRFVSCEPLLGPVCLESIRIPEPYRGAGVVNIDSLNGRSKRDGIVRPSPHLSWVIAGAQTGHGARLPDPEWVQRIINQCRMADVPLFLKNNLLWPEEIKEYPR